MDPDQTAGSTLYVCMPKLVLDISIYMQQTFSDPFLCSRGRVSNDDRSVAYQLFVCVLVYMFQICKGLNLSIFMESSIQSDDQSSIIYHCTYIHFCNGSQIRISKLHCISVPKILILRFLFNQTHSATLIHVCMTGKASNKEIY